MSDKTTLDNFTDKKTNQRVQQQESVFEESPGDWEVSNLNNSRLFKSTSSGLETFSDSKIYIPTAGVEGGQVVDDDGYITYDSRPSRANLELSIGDVIFAKMKDSIKVSRASKELAEDYVFSTGFIRISPKNNVNPEYLKQVLLSSNFNQRKDSLAIGSTQPAIRLSDLSALNIPIPPIHEQHKIATVLYTVDRLIEKTEEIESQLHRVKKGAKQRLFTYGINNEETQSHHIGDFPESWKFEKISNLAEIERGNTPRTSHDEYYGGDITWVTPDDLSDLNEDGNGKYISDSGRKLTPEGVESSSLTVVEPDSVMFTSRSYGIGRTAICTVPAATNQGITAFDCGESLDTEFFYYYLNYIMEYVVSISGGSTFPEISKSATGNIDVPVPDIDEQKEIASILSQFDEQILHNRKVTSQLKRLKRGLMQDLLSGTVRTTDTNIEVPDEIAQYG